MPTKTLNRPSWPAAKEGRRAVGGRVGEEGHCGSAERAVRKKMPQNHIKKIKKEKEKKNKI